MKNKDLAVVILAAGKGTRLKSSLAKVLHRAGGRTLIEQVVRACVPLGAKKTIVVVGHQTEEVTATVAPFGAAAVLQQPQHGTGHAMQVARRALGNAKFAIVLPGDAPLVRPETLKALLATHRAGGAAATVLTAVVAAPAGYGRILRKSDTAISAIVEESQLTGDQAEINEIIPPFIASRWKNLWPALAQVKPNNKHREIYLTDAVAMLAAKGEKVLAQVAADSREVLGCNTRADLAEVDRIFREWKRCALMDAGVTIQLPETVLIDPDVIAGEDTVIEPGVQLLGKTKIGARCTIRTGSVFSDAIVGDDVVVEPHCVVAESRLDDRVIIGPFARLRGGTHLKAGARDRQFRRSEEKHYRRRHQGDAPHLSRRRENRIQNQHRRRNHHLQLRRFPQASHHHRQQSFYRQRLCARCARSRRGRRISSPPVPPSQKMFRPMAWESRAAGSSNKPGWASKKRRELAASARATKAPPEKNRAARRKKRRR